MSEYVPTTDEIRYRVEHDWAPYGDGSFDAWLAAHDAQVKAEAWDEGWKRGFRDFQARHLDEDGYEVIVPTTNPYRIEQEGAGR